MTESELEYWPVVQQVASEMAIPVPYLVLAIGARESGWGSFLSPTGPTGTGDGGHGRGLMQIDDRAFPKWCLQRQDDGSFTWQDPVENIRQGCRVIRSAWLQLLSWPATICAYNAGTTIAAYVDRNFPPGEVPLAAYDAHTTGNDYVAWVIDHWARAELGVPGAQVTCSIHGLERTP